MPLRSLDVTEKRRLALSAAVRARIFVLRYAVDIAIQRGDTERSRGCQEEIKTLEGCARALGVLDAEPISDATGATVLASPDAEQAEPQLPTRRPVMSNLIYHPEMGETADLTVLFQTHHNFRNSYSIQWLASRDAEAQAAFKRLRIRPRSVTRQNSANYSTPLKGDIFSGLITSAAEDKLGEAGLRCLKMLLD